jgi:MFS family permease
VVSKVPLTARPGVASEADASEASIRYAWYVVGVLTLISIFFFVDQEILSLMVAPIRHDLKISDSQMSVLMGFGYSALYALLGIAMGRLVDRYSRRFLVGMGCALWSVATAGCGLAQSFWELLLLRMGVGAGQATLFPAQFSLVADYFSKDRLATPMSVLMVSLPIGQGLSYVFGGLVIGLVTAHASTTLPVIGASVRPWQIVLLLVGLPGVVLALLMYTVREPVRRDRKTGDDASRTAYVPLREVLRYFGKNKRAYLCLSVGLALMTLTSYDAWGPSLFIRSYGWSPGRTGVVYGLAMMISGTAGLLAGGRLAEWLAKRGYRDANMRVGMISSLAWFPTVVLFPLMPTAGWALALFLPSYFIEAAPWGVAAAALQQMTPNSMRGQATGLYRFTLYLIAGVFAPTFVAVMTDYVFHDDHALRYSIAIAGSIGQLGAAFVLWRGLKHFRGSLDALEGDAVADRTDSMSASLVIQ